MSHSPYDEWLFSDDPRSATELAELRQHLASCARCRLLQAAWGEARRDLESSPQAAPRPGFAGRWEARLAQERQRRAHRQSIGLLAILGTCLAGAIVGYAWMGSPALLRLPGLGNLVSAAVRGLANTTTLYYIGRQILSSLTGPIMPVAMVGGGGILTAAAAGLIGAWLLVIYQLNWSQAQKGAQR
jgi:predicted anti-sigma-YlaC factor YlaD